MTLTDEIEAAVKLAKAATPGPWFEQQSKVYSLANVVPVAPRPDTTTASFAEIPYTKNDCKFIAASHAHVGLIERLGARIKELEDERRAWEMEP